MSIVHRPDPQLPLCSIPLYSSIPLHSSTRLCPTGPRATVPLSLIVLLVAFGCGDDTAADAGVDAGTDVATADANADATTDVGGTDSSPTDTGSPDVGIDVGTDAGPIGSAGCESGDGIPEGENTFRFSDRDRRFILRLPNGYSQDRPWPLLFALHGNGGNAGFWDRESGDANVRGEVEDDAILIIAEAIDNRWRNYDADRDTWPALIEEELLYFDELVDRATSELCVNEGEIFSMGFSGGGSFSGVLGCRRDYIRAIAAGGAVIYFDTDACVQRPPAWLTVGDVQEGRNRFRDYYRDGAGCDDRREPTVPEPCEAYQGCDDGVPVHYCEHSNGHRWPDFATQAMWTFLSQFIDP